MISRMQLPRQNYGLGSFVKKATRKITRPITKIAKKIVPKEVAGIMRAAAPFLPPGYREAAYLLGTAKQTGRISPMDLALTLAPTYFKSEKFGGKQLAQKFGNIKLPGMERNLREVAVGGKQDALVGRLDADPNLGPLVGSDVRSAMSAQISPPTDIQGLFGKGGKFNLIKGSMLSDPTGKLKKSSAFALGTGLLSLVQSAKTPQEAGKNLAAATGNSDDYDRGFALFNQLPDNIFDIGEEYRLSSSGGSSNELPKLLAANGGLMRTNFARGSDDEPKPLPNDPTEPVNPFRPKPIGPFPSKMASVDDPFYRDSEGDRDEHSFRMFKKPYKELNENELEEFQEEMMRLMNKFSKSKSEGIMMAGLDRKERAQMLADQLAEEEFGMDFYDLDIRTQMKIYQIALDMIDEGGNAMGGLPNNRMNFALGTRPTAQESGLGGLPIEADMRYTGGFMPYGAKEKADDVPARLSKNEFVFTADAVRAAGGGSVQKGAQKMYNTMKQLEAKPEAKGMMA